MSSTKCYCSASLCCYSKQLSFLLIQQYAAIANLLFELQNLLFIDLDVFSVCVCKQVHVLLTLYGHSNENGVTNG